MSAACRAAGVGRATHYLWMQEDQDYRAAFEEAHATAIESLESEARRRAVDGWDEPVFHDGLRCGRKRKYSDTLLIFLMKGAAPEKYRDVVETKHSGKVEHSHVMEELKAMVDDARRDGSYVQLERQRAIANGPVPGTNGHNGHAGPLGDGKALGTD